MLRVVMIASEKFAAYHDVQDLVKLYLRTVSVKAADWFEEWWTSECERYGLCHATHGVSNNNMGVEDSRATGATSRSSVLSRRLWQLSLVLS